MGAEALFSPSLQGEPAGADREIGPVVSERALMLTAFFGGPSSVLLLGGLSARRLGLGWRGVAVVAAGAFVALGLRYGLVMVVWSDVLAEMLQAKLLLANTPDLETAGPIAEAALLVEARGDRVLRYGRLIGKAAALVLAAVVSRMHRGPKRREQWRRPAGLDHVNGLVWGLGAIVLAMPLEAAAGALALGAFAAVVG